jgi:hypothetical protein
MTKIDQGITLRLTTEYRLGKPGENYEVVGPTETWRPPRENPNEELVGRKP